MAQVITNKELDPNKRVKPAQQGTGFTNLSQITQANKDNKLGQAVGGGVQQLGQQAKQNLGQAQNQFQQEAQANTLGTDQDKQKQQELISKAVNDPNSLSEEEKKQYQTFAAGQYKGPQTLANEQMIKNQASQAQQFGQLGQSQGGRQALLQRFIGGSAPSYSQGQQKLDTLLLGGANKDLRGARQATAGLGSQAQSAADVARKDALARISQSGQFGEQSKQAVTGSQGTIQSEVDKAVADAKAREQQQRANIDQFRQAGQIKEGQSDVDIINNQQSALQQALGSGTISQDEFERANNLLEDQKASVSFNAAGTFGSLMANAKAAAADLDSKSPAAGGLVKQFIAQGMSPEEAAQKAFMQAGPGNTPARLDQFTDAARNYATAMQKRTQAYNEFGVDEYGNATNMPKTSDTQSVATQLQNLLQFRESGVNLDDQAAAREALANQQQRAQVNALQGLIGGTPTYQAKDATYKGASTGFDQERLGQFLRQYSPGMIDKLKRAGLR